MAKNNKKGFSLVELITVIVLIGIIALIATTVVNYIIIGVNKKSVENLAYGIIRAGDIYYSKKDMKGEELEDEIFNFPSDIGNLEIKGKLPEKGNMKINEKGDISLAITSGKYCVTKGYKENKVIITENICIIK